MEYWVYLIRCRDKSLYCGVTTDLARRLREHNQGRGAKYTSGRLPVSLARAWRVNTRSEALRLEAGIKKCSRKKKEELIQSADSVRSLGFPFLCQTG